MMTPIEYNRDYRKVATLLAASSIFPKRQSHWARFIEESRWRDRSGPIHHRRSPLAAAMLFASIAAMNLRSTKDYK